MSEISFVKVVIVGDSGTGKTSIVNYMRTKTFSHNTISTTGPNFEKIIVDKNGFHCEMRLWDTAGQEKYQAFTAQYIRDADCIILVYETISLLSFQNCPKWIELIRNNTNNDIPIVLTCNKCDLPQDYDDSMADKLGCDDYIRVSARTGDQIEELQYTSAKLAQEFHQKNNIQQTVSLKQKQNKKKGCCR